MFLKREFAAAASGDLGKIACSDPQVLGWDLSVFPMFRVVLVLLALGKHLVLQALNNIRDNY